jgi:hypothetical protein
LFSDFPREPRILSPHANNIVRTAARRYIAKPLRAAIRSSAREMKVALLTAGNERRFQSLRGGLRVNLGSGEDMRAGWLNIDIVPRRGRGIRRVDDLTTFVNHDLRRGLPLRPGSCSVIYASHLLEHLSPSDSNRLVADCWEALEIGGLLRVAVPDIRPIAASYVSRDREHLELLEACHLSGR